VEVVEQLNELCNLGLQGQDGSAQVEGSLLLSKAAAGDGDDAGGLQQLQEEGEGVKGRGLRGGWGKMVEREGVGGWEIGRRASRLQGGSSGIGAAR
jgi:hypothetical protein